MTDISDTINLIRTKKPIVHCITNVVTINDCANVLCCVGASPIMAHHINEVAEVTSKADAFVCNLGASDYYSSIEKSVEAANIRNIPVSMDPVGISVSTFRRDFARELFRNHHIDCIRGNYSEIMSLLTGKSYAGGLDNQLTAKDIDEEALLDFARNNNCIIFMTGLVDYIVDKDVGTITKIDKYSKVSALKSISGSGCMLSALTGAFLSVDNSAKAINDLSLVYRECGSLAKERADKLNAGNMSFKLFLMDEISLARKIG